MNLQFKKECIIRVQVPVASTAAVLVEYKPNSINQIQNVNEIFENYWSEISFLYMIPIVEDILSRDNVPHDTRLIGNSLSYKYLMAKFILFIARLLFKMSSREEYLLKAKIFRKEEETND